LFYIKMKPLFGVRHSDSNINSPYCTVPQFRKDGIPEKGLRETCSRPDTNWPISLSLSRLWIRK
jgi:hypothetical protein